MNRSILTLAIIGLTLSNASAFERVKTLDFDNGSAHGYAYRCNDGTSAMIVKDGSYVSVYHDGKMLASGPMSNSDTIYVLAKTACDEQ